MQLQKYFVIEKLHEKYNPRKNYLKFLEFYFAIQISFIAFFIFF
jgi:hypothetical protein